MREPADALLSFQNHIWLSLGDEWEVRLTGEEGAFRRPFARVSMTGERSFGGAAARQVEMKSTFQVVAHPIETTTPDRAKLESLRVESLLGKALRFGGAAPGHPKRVPLYDFSEVEEGESLEAAEARLGHPLRDPRDYLSASSNDHPTVSSYQDADDEMLFVVTAAIRMSWMVSAAVPSTGMLVTRVTPTFKEG